MAKFAAEAPIPIIRVTAAVAVKPGVRRRDRKAYRKDCKRSINAFWSGGRALYAAGSEAVSGTGRPRHASAARIGMTTGGLAPTFLPNGSPGSRNRRRGGGALVSPARRVESRQLASPPLPRRPLGRGDAGPRQRQPAPRP